MFQVSEQFGTFSYGSIFSLDIFACPKASCLDVFASYDSVLPSSQAD
jgi:hypothetical protein